MKRHIKKNLTILLSSTLFIILGFVLFSCRNTVEDMKQVFYVSYTSKKGEVPAPVKVYSGDMLTLEQLPDLTYEDFTFNGWYLDGELIKPDTYIVTGDIILEASWTGLLCKISFTHTSNISGQDFTKTVEKGDEFTLPKTPYGTKTGLEFKGWLCDEIYYAENSTFVVNGDVTFTAYYAEQGTHTISYYNVCNGTLVSDSSKFLDAVYLTGTENPQSFTESEDVFISGLQKTGYTFGGWYTDSTCDKKAETYWKAGTVSKDIQLYAKWNVKTYTIKFDANAGSLINPSDPHVDITATYEEEITLPQCKYELTDCEFVAWSVKAEHFETEFAQGQTIGVEELCTETSSNIIILYVHWRDAVPPAAPTNFRITNVERTQITLAWNFSNESGLAYTRLSYHQRGSNKKQFKDFTAEDYDLGSAFEYTVTNLELGKPYNFTLTSYDIAGNANNYNASCNLSAVPRPHAYVPELRFSQNSPTELVVSWDAPDAEEYPYIEKISVVINGTEVGEGYTALDSQGDCYDQDSYICPINAFEVYDVQLKLAEKVDETGRTNSSETEVYKYYSEPDYNAAIKTVDINGFDYTYWTYSDSFGFDLDLPIDEFGVPIPASSYKIFVECTPLDSKGNEILRNRTIKETVYDSAREIYIRDALEADTSYNVRIYISAQNNSHTVYSYSLAEVIEGCKTTSRYQAELGYICYNANSYYKQVQKAGTPIGIVTEVNSFNEAKKVMALDQETVANLSEAVTKALQKPEGNLSWKVPTKAELDNVFTQAAAQTILENLMKAGGELFEESTTNPDGTFVNKYITQTAGSAAGTVYAYDISGFECSPVQQVASDGSQGTFALRAFATITLQE